MKRSAALTALLLLAWAAPVSAKEVKSWFAYQDSTLEVHVANRVRFANIAGHTLAMRLSEFAPQWGALWAKNLQADSTLLAIPVIFRSTRPVHLEPGDTLIAIVYPNRRMPMVDAEWAHTDTVVTPEQSVNMIACISGRYPLETIKGFEMVWAGRHLTLTQQDKLK